MLQHHSVKNVVVLNGGLKKWLKDGRPVVENAPLKTDFDGEGENFQISSVKPLAYIDDMHQVAEELDSRPSDFKQVIDARDAADYGKSGDGKNSNIKNSINLPFEEVLNADGTFKSDDEIK